MRSVRMREADVRKTSLFSVIINVMQALVMLVLAVYLWKGESLQKETVTLIRWMAAAGALVVGGGAILDIRDALSARKLSEAADAMEKTMEDMEALNNTLRVQRHDFLNHLQVVYSLMEMEEFREAGAYIERVYGEITSLSRVMKTANPAINALLQVKTAACDRWKIHWELEIRSPWKDLPMPGWEMCKVLSNLIDNAIDALKEVSDRKLRITMTEDLHDFRFEVWNNGPMIPVKRQTAIFLSGVSGKGEGRGMGLYIVRETMHAYGGEIEVASLPEGTCFRGWIPRDPGREEEEKEAGTPA